MSKQLDGTMVRVVDRNGARIDVEMSDGNVYRFTRGDVVSLLQSMNASSTQAAIAEARQGSPSGTEPK